MKRAAILNEYDLIKTFAVIIMIVDHIGYYFFPEELWWRAVGRIGFPIWFFLVGHARGRDISAKLLGGALILLAANVVVGMPLLPLNALVTIILLRLLLERVVSPLKQKPEAIWFITAILVLLLIPSIVVTEYGTVALLFAMFGYLVRHVGEEPYDAEQRQFFMAFIAVIFIVYQKFLFGFSLYEMIFMSAGTLVVSIVLLNFTGRNFTALDAHAPAFVKGVFHFCGSRTLEIYVFHLLLFKFTALAIGAGDFRLFEFSLM